MSLPCEEMMEILKQSAEADLPRLKQMVFTKLEKREQGVWNWLYREYEDETKKRWYDPYHIAFSTDFALTLIQQESIDRLIVPAIILHDVGYFAVEDKTKWSDPNIRIIHMQEGAAIASRVLMENNYDPIEVEKAVGMISCHDNRYIGLSIQGPDRLGLRDCDRVWVMHPLSFYKDTASKPERCEWPQKFLKDRIVQFFACASAFGPYWQVTPDEVQENAKRIEVPTFTFTRARVHKQFEQRIYEWEHGIFNDLQSFRQCVQSQITNE